MEPDTSFLVNQSTLADILGISQPEVVGLVKKGLPKISRSNAKANEILTKGMCAVVYSL